MGERRTGPYGTESGNPSRTRVSVDEAARALGVTVDAIRKRVQRGTIPHERDEDSGRVWVLLDAASTMQDTASTVRDEDRDATGHAGRELLEAKDETITELRERVASLERRLEAADTANRENRRLLAAALERIPAIEAPTDAPHARQSDAEASEEVDAPENRAAPQTGAQAAQTTARRPWWVRILGG